MKKLVMLAAVLLGTTAASQAGIDIHVGIPLPPLPRVVIGHPAPCVVPPQHCVVRGCVYTYPHHHGTPRYVVHGQPGYWHGHRHHDCEWSGGHGHSHGHRHGHR